MNTFGQLLTEFGQKKRLGLVRTEPKGQKLKISELMSKLIQNNDRNITHLWRLQNQAYLKMRIFCHDPSLSLYLHASLSFIFMAQVVI